MLPRAVLIITELRAEALVQYPPASVRMMIFSCADWAVSLKDARGAGQRIARERLAMLKDNRSLAPQRKVEWAKCLKRDEDG